MSNTCLPTSRRNNLVVQEVKNEILIYNLEENKAFCLNETSALVWQACNGKRSIQEIGVYLKIDNEDLVWLAVNELKESNLLENCSEIITKFQGVSRREVIKKIGLATMIALPIISSLVVPTSALAQGSCGAINTPCHPVNNNNCCPGLQCQGNTCRV